MEIDAARCAAAVDSAMLATDVADFLVRRGVPFREARGAVGKLVRAAEGMGCPLSALPRELFVQVSAEFAHADLDAMFDARASVEARAAAGGTSSASVQAQIAELTTVI